MKPKKYNPAVSKEVKELIEKMVHRYFSLNYGESDEYGNSGCSDVYTPLLGVVERSSIEDIVLNGAARKITNAVHWHALGNILDCQYLWRLKKGVREEYERCPEEFAARAAEEIWNERRDYLICNIYGLKSMEELDELVE